MTQAALGATLTVPTLDGDVELEFEPGTQPGEVRVLRGRGMPVLQGQRPRRPPPARQRHRAAPADGRAARACSSEFERTADDETYRPDEGFFDKLKSAFR